MNLPCVDWFLHECFASDPSTLDPKEDPAEFNDLVQNASTNLQKNMGDIKNNIFGK